MRLTVTTVAVLACTGCSSSDHTGDGRPAWLDQCSEERPCPMGGPEGEAAFSGTLDGANFAIDSASDADGRALQSGCTSPTYTLYALREGVGTGEVLDLYFEFSLDASGQPSPTPSVHLTLNDTPWDYYNTEDPNECGPVQFAITIEQREEWSLIGTFQGMVRPCEGDGTPQRQLAGSFDVSTCFLYPPMD